MNRLSKLFNHFQSSSQDLTHKTVSNNSSIRRIVRFHAQNDSKIYYGILNDEQPATTGTDVSLLKYSDIYDSKSYERTSITKCIDKLLPPIDPINIFCIGLNYKTHAKESEMQLPKHPVIFSKPTTSIIGANEDILIPSVCCEEEMDYEVELVIVIGKKCKDVKEEDALNYVLGYSVANDVSARQWQLDKDKSGGQWVRGKSFDTFCPFGPCLLLEGVSGVNAQNMNLYTRLNGDIVQNSNTENMIFSIKKLISFLSASTTLLPGTIILSGTPNGVGFARKPPLYLKNGDNVVVGVEGIDELENNVLYSVLPKEGVYV